MKPGSHSIEVADAAKAVLVSLLAKLVEKSVLSNGDVRALLTKAAYDLHPHEYAAPAEDPAGIILKDLLPQFPENGGD